MMKRILVPLDASSFSESATKHACAIARRTGARVVGKAVIDEIKPVSNSAPSHALAASYATAAQAADRKQRHQRIGEVLAVFSRTCTELGVAHEEARIQGASSEIVIEQSIFYDLVVTGFHSKFADDDSDEESSVGDLLGSTITPFLIVPCVYEEIKKVLVCFDGSLSSMRSLQDFAVVAAVSNFEITILTANQSEKESAFLLQRASEYLQAQGVAGCRTVADPGPIKEVVREMLDEDFDLVVVGVHSRRTVRDFFMGSLVIDLLERATIPVFLGQ